MKSGMMVEYGLVGGTTTFHLGFAFQPAYKALSRIGVCWFAFLAVFGNALWRRPE